MLTAGSPLAGNQIHRPKSARQPLQQINSPANFSTPATPIIKATTNGKPSPKLRWIEISISDDSNKENLPAALVHATIETFDASLAEELSAIRERMERLRLDREKTEKMLLERDLMLEMQINEVSKRGEMQKVLEMEVDRLYRLKELRSSCMRVSPIRSLREKEQEKIKEDKPEDIEHQDMDEMKDKRRLQSPSSDTDMEMEMSYNEL